MKLVKFKGRKLIKCLESRKNLIFGGTLNGELIIMSNSYPFNVIYYQKINSGIYSISFNQKYLLVGGYKKDPLKLFEILEIKENKKISKSQQIKNK